MQPVAERSKAVGRRARRRAGVREDASVFSVLAIERERERRPSSLLSSSGGFDVVSTFDLADGVARLRSGAFDAVIVEARLTGPRGLRGLSLLREAAPDLPVLFVCDESDTGGRLGLQALRAGAQDCLLEEELSASTLSRALVHGIERSRSVAPRGPLAARDTGEEHRLRDLELAKEELEAFNYRVAHDLRGPLCTVMGMSELLLQESRDRLDRSAKQYVERIRAAAASMECVLEGLLRLGMTAGALKPAPVDISAIVREALEEKRLEQPERKLEIHIQDDIVVFADPFMLRLAINNLIGNAWKFTVACEPARIEFGRRGLGPTAPFFLTDNGLGFEPAIGPLLFKPFFRGNGRVAGLGVGLATVERVIRRHGGRVWAEGEPGVGSTFYFTLGEH